MMTRDRSTGLIALLLGIAVAISTYQLPASKMAGDIGPKVFPGIAAAGLIICGLGLLITGKNKGTDGFSMEQGKRLAIISLVVILYAVLMNFVGFVVPTMAMLFVMSTMFSQGKEKKVLWWHRLIFAVVLTLLLYFSFTNLLGLKLPTNNLF